MNALSITGEMTIYRAAELKALMADAAPAGGEIGLDLSQVAEIDCSGVQLLLALRTAVGEDALRLVRPSAAVAEALGVLNLTFAETP
jgi:anti-sigma B factor antagonist